MRKLVLAAALALAAPCLAATSFSTDVSDLWWNPDESGWGVNVIQQGNVVFATFFVYDANRRAHWYVASEMTASSSSANDVTFTGDLIETQGPYFGVPFNASAVSRNKVGSATLHVTFPGSGTLTYTVNGSTVAKAIVRQTWAVNDASGAYEGARGIDSASSAVGCNIGTTSFSNIRLAQSNSSFAMTGVLGGTACRFAGSYSQQGRFGASTGTFACDSGLQGTYSISEIETTLYGFSARYSGTERGCSISGRIGGFRTTILRPPAE